VYVCGILCRRLAKVGRARRKDLLKRIANSARGIDWVCLKRGEESMQRIYLNRHKLFTLKNLKTSLNRFEAILTKISTPQNTFTG
jgi:hypothetical protein